MVIAGGAARMRPQVPTEIWGYHYRSPSARCPDLRPLGQAFATSEDLLPSIKYSFNFNGTHLTHSSALQQAGEQIHKIVNSRIEEIKEYTFKRGGFFKKNFESKT